MSLSCIFTRIETYDNTLHDPLFSNKVAAGGSGSTAGPEGHKGGKQMSVLLLKRHKKQVR